MNSETHKLYMQQMTLQVVFGQELMEINQAHRKQFPGFNQCDADCVICATEEGFKVLEEFMAKADNPGRDEPFGEKGAVLLERVVMESRKNPVILLNNTFIPALYRISMELIKEEMEMVSAWPFVPTGRLSRVQEMVRFITKEKFEPLQPLEAQFQAIYSPGDYEAFVRVFEQTDEDNFVGRTSLIYAVVNLQMTYSVNKLPNRTIRWNGDVSTLNEAAPKNSKFTYEVKTTAYANGYSISDYESEYPDDKYDEDHFQFWINPTIDDYKLNQDIKMAIYPDFIDNSRRVIIC